MGKALPVTRQNAENDTVTEFRRRGEAARHLRAQLAASFVASEAIIREMRAIRANLPGPGEATTGRLALPGKGDTGNPVKLGEPDQDPAEQTAGEPGN
ncbi:MAG: hypothetical protein LAT62_07970 [Natronospirillum sp.]|uniref:hypothetical protein n=1 Tax=Natronospirillum sp. TaxID=2812955 RepID=UPI0025DCD661|nr:hypothetical protein [Natronospirillum sp.]MCH8551857.1 hypothetical protein [Natronospirillum sp.]